MVPTIATIDVPPERQGNLEATLGVKLFARDGKRIVITSAGKQYLAVIRDALDRIAVGTERLLRYSASNTLTVSTSPDFGAKWLVHRLGRFAAAYPEIDRRVSTTIKQVDLIAQRVDLAIRHGDGHWAGLDAVPLCKEDLCRFAALNSYLVAIVSGRRLTVGTSAAPFGRLGHLVEMV